MASTIIEDGGTGAIAHAASDLAGNSNSTDGPESSSDSRNSLHGGRASSGEDLHDNENGILAVLNGPEITAAEIAEISKRAIAAKSRKVVKAIVLHPRTPRHISVPLLRRMFTFDLVQVTMTPAVAADIKRAAEGQIVLRAESLTVGEKLSLAKRGPGRVAADLLQENDARMIAPALDNAQMTEILVAQALMKPDAPERLFVLVSGHAKWPLRREVQIALLRSEKTPVAWAKDFARHFTSDFLRDIVPDSRRSELMGGI